jgi:hypothetical protein
MIAGDLPHESASIEGQCLDKSISFRGQHALSARVSLMFLTISRSSPPISWDVRDCE